MSTAYIRNVSIQCWSTNSWYKVRPDPSIIAYEQCHYRKRTLCSIDSPIPLCMTCWTCAQTHTRNLKLWAHCTYTSSRNDMLMLWPPKQRRFRRSSVCASHNVGTRAVQTHTNKKTTTVSHTCNNKRLRAILNSHIQNGDLSVCRCASAAAANVYASASRQKQQPHSNRSQFN